MVGLLLEVTHNQTTLIPYYLYNNYFCAQLTYYPIKLLIMYYIDIINNRWYFEDIPLNAAVYRATG